MEKREFSSTVTSVDGCEVELADTVFYPRSGGVEGDTGELDRDGEVFKVVSVTKDKGRVIHKLDREGIKVGDSVSGRLDWDRRLQLMRYHTSAHVISGVFAKQFGARITGNQLTVEKGRIDFSLEDYDPQILDQGIGEANKIIARDLEVRTYTMPRAEVEKDPDLVKLAMGLPPGIKNLRIVDIVGFDAQPDGGCHVSSLSQVGTVEFLKADNKGKNNRRLYYVLR